MAPNFERFTGKGAIVASRETSLTIQKGGVFSLTESAWKSFGSPDYVELLYAKDERIIAIEPSTKDVGHAYPVRHADGSGQWLISASAFTRTYEIDAAESRRYKTFIDGDYLCVDLNTKPTVIVGSRSGKRNGHARPGQLEVLKG